MFVCDNMAFSGAIRPVFAKHGKHFNLIKSLSIGVDQMRRNFKPMMEQVEPLAGLAASRCHALTAQSLSLVD